MSEASALHSRKPGGQLEQIVRELEDGQIGLEESLTRYESGVGLFKRCYTQLCDAEQPHPDLTGVDEDGSPSRIRSSTPPPPSRNPGHYPKNSRKDDTCEASLTSDLSHYLHAKRQLVEEQLRMVLRAREGCPPALLEAMRYSLLAPGKRLRPLLVILAAEACAADDTHAVPAAAAVEMVHTYSLIHDDLPAMDDDDLRRGLPTCHKKFGEALAILAGDALLTLAFQVLAEGYPPRTAARLLPELARGAGAAAWSAGRWRTWPGKARRQALADLEDIHARKTGALFRACLRLGVWPPRANACRPRSHCTASAWTPMAAASAWPSRSPTTCSTWKGRRGQTGKRVQKDAARGKLTYPGFLGARREPRVAERWQAVKPAPLTLRSAARAAVLDETGQVLQDHLDLAAVDPLKGRNR